MNRIDNASTYCLTLANERTGSREAKWKTECLVTGLIVVGKHALNDVGNLTDIR